MSNDAPNSAPPVTLTADQLADLVSQTFYNSGILKGTTYARQLFEQVITISDNKIKQLEAQVQELKVSLTKSQEAFNAVDESQPDVSVDAP